MDEYYPGEYYSIGQDPEILFGGRRRLPARLLATTALWGGSPGESVVRATRNGEAARYAGILRSVARAGLRRGRSTRIIDVGSGSGFLVHLLALGGLTNVLGVDPYLPADRLLTSGAKLERGHLGESGTGWDIVMFHHSFEHVADPMAELALAKKALAPGGSILIRMPTVSSWAFQRYGAAWFQLDAPRHLTIASRLGVEALAAQVGLRVSSVIDDSTAVQFWRSDQIAADLDAGRPPQAVRPPELSAAELRTLAHEAVKLNRAAAGDQAAWVLREE
ncbi:class I SAM-dependent methyltransferase [Nostocoides sp. HKS02]|uniref:class I SAM-dependent methyltransferase n=1 Tax=Nostocoides sp. HKS02 TaxID=1813880 RepID=UPI0018A83EDD|nr:class I SAM-dependent methyltransferase [Tetrasphaera sp. HKS02]